MVASAPAGDGARAGDGETSTPLSFPGSFDVIGSRAVTCALEATGFGMIELRCLGRRTRLLRFLNHIKISTVMITIIIIR